MTITSSSLISERANVSHVLLSTRKEQFEDIEQVDPDQMILFCSCGRTTAEVKTAKQQSAFYTEDTYFSMNNESGDQNMCEANFISELQCNFINIFNEQSQEIADSYCVYHHDKHKIIHPTIKVNKDSKSKQYFSDKSLIRYENIGIYHFQKTIQKTFMLKSQKISFVKCRKVIGEKKNINFIYEPMYTLTRNDNSENSLEINIVVNEDKLSVVTLRVESEIDVIHITNGHVKLNIENNGAVLDTSLIGVMHNTAGFHNVRYTSPRILPNTSLYNYLTFELSALFDGNIYYIYSNISVNIRNAWILLIARTREVPSKLISCVKSVLTFFTNLNKSEEKYTNYFTKHFRGTIQQISNSDNPDLATFARLDTVVCPIVHTKAPWIILIDNHEGNTTKYTYLQATSSKVTKNNHTAYILHNLSSKNLLLIPNFAGNLYIHVKPSTIQYDKYIRKLYSNIHESSKHIYCNDIQSVFISIDTTSPIAKINVVATELLRDIYTSSAVKENDLLVTYSNYTNGLLTSMKSIKNVPIIFSAEQKLKI
jgi:hypothetical protein